MRTEDIIKLKKADYSVIRAIDHPNFAIAAYQLTTITIDEEQISDWGIWQIIKRYDNKIDRDRELEKMLENEKVILD